MKNLTILAAMTALAGASLLPTGAVGAADTPEPTPCVETLDLNVPQSVYWNYAEGSTVIPGTLPDGPAATPTFVPEPIVLPAEWQGITVTAEWRSDNTPNPSVHPDSNIIGETGDVTVRADDVEAADTTVVQFVTAEGEHEFVTGATFVVLVEFGADGTWSAGGDVHLSTPCEVPEPIVTYSDWEDGVWLCDDTTVTITRTATRTTFTWNGDEFVGSDTSELLTDVRTLDEDEVFPCPTREPLIVVSEWETIEAPCGATQAEQTRSVTTTVYTWNGFEFDVTSSTAIETQVIDIEPTPCPCPEGGICGPAQADRRPTPITPDPGPTPNDVIVTPDLTYLPATGTGTTVALVAAAIMFTVGMIFVLIGRRPRDHRRR